MVSTHTHPMTLSDGLETPLKSAGMENLFQPLLRLIATVGKESKNVYRNCQFWDYATDVLLIN